MKIERLNESSTKTVKLEVAYEPYSRDGYGSMRVGRVSGEDLKDALINMLDRMRMYTNSETVDEYEEEGTVITPEWLLNRIS
jgi:hypothetical protein